MKIVLSIACSLIVAGAAFAQSAGVILQSPGTPVVLVDMNTNAVTTAATTNAPSPVIMARPAFDLGSGRLFFYSGNGGVQTLTVVNIGTGAVQFVPAPYVPGYSSLVFDPSVGLLFSIGLGSGTTPVLSIDPATGSVQSVLTTSIAVPDSDLAFDPATRRLFLFSTNSLGTQNLNTINLTTGVVTTVSIASATTTYDALQYDPVTNRVLALGVGAFGTRILSIDPVSGAAQTLITIPPGTATVPKGMAFEPFSRRVIIYNGNGNSLVFVNLANGTVTNSGALPGGLPYGFFAVPATGAIPTLSTIALLLLSVTIAAIALRRL